MARLVGVPKGKGKNIQTNARGGMHGYKKRGDI